ncbi:DNA-directed RNA polymerase I subunit rpa43 [Paramyrothecium foliicola]|nr:DNA-directed RNA polymerase I subunit rpa43 [Paramyrothecium foliicola]
MAPIESVEPAAVRSEKKSKKEKSSKSEKKRAREDDAAADSEPKHKKSKSVSTSLIAPISTEPAAANGDAVADKKKKKKDKKSKSEDSVDAVPMGSEKPEKKHKKKAKDEAAPEVEDHADAVADDGESKKRKKKKKDAEVADDAAPAEKKKSKKSRDKAATELASEQPEVTADANVEAMDVDEPAQTQPSKLSDIYQPPDIPANPQFPFYSQTVSLYEPLYPIGWAQPVTSAQSQHLRHLRNSYVPSLRGVLMDYKNVALSEYPGRQGAATDDDGSATVVSKDEFAVGFGWITADVELFVPSRGAWMEGSVNLQTEGHIGVVCFGKFNASIEARRLPSDWKWVPNESPDAQGFEETASVITADDHGVVRQIHSTGFWADGAGQKVKGKIRFRIRNFDVGTSGETSYLSLEGTMLDKQGEKRLVAEEAETARLRREKKSGQRREKKRAPEFAMTRFSTEGGEEGQENANEASEQPMQWTTSRAASES